MGDSNLPACRCAELLTYLSPGVDAEVRGDKGRTPRRRHRCLLPPAAGGENPRTPSSRRVPCVGDSVQQRRRSIQRDQPRRCEASRQPQGGGTTPAADVAHHRRCGGGLCRKVDDCACRVAAADLRGMDVATLLVQQLIVLEACSCDIPRCSRRSSR